MPAAADEEEDGDSKPKNLAVVEVVPDEVFSSNKSILGQVLLFKIKIIKVRKIWIYDYFYFF